MPDVRFREVSNDSSSAGRSSVSLSHDAGVGENRVLIAVLRAFTNIGDPVVSSITYGGEAMTELVSKSEGFDANFGKMFVYALEEPPAGSNTFSLDYTFNMAADEVTLISVDRVRLSNPYGFTASGSASSGVASLESKSEAAGTLHLFSAMFQGYDALPITQSDNLTELDSGYTGTGLSWDFPWIDAYARNDGESVTATFTQTVADDWIICAVELYAAPVTPPSAVTLEVADRFGHRFEELPADVEVLGWVLNGVGYAAWNIRADDEKATERNLRFGNRVRVEAANGIRPWGGVIDFPRDWREGKVFVTCYSGEFPLGWRRTGKIRRFNNATAGAIVTTLIDEANAEENTGVRPSSIHMGGSGHSPSYHLGDVLDKILTSVIGRLESFDFGVDPVIENDRIKFDASLYDTRGALKEGIALIEGANVESIRLTEHGPVVNRFTAAGDGLTWGDERLTSTFEDEESRGRYGLREDAEVFPGVINQGTLDNHARTRVEELKQPKRVLVLTVTNKAPAKFGDYWLGDTLPLEATSVGFSGANVGLQTHVRVVGVEYRPAEGRCVLAVEEV